MNSVLPLGKELELRESTVWKYFIFGFSPAEITNFSGVDRKDVEAFIFQFQKAIAELKFDEKEQIKFLLKEQIKYLQKEILLSLNSIEAIESEKEKRCWLEFLLRTVNSLANLEGFPRKVEVSKKSLSVSVPVEKLENIPQSVIDWVKRHGSQILTSGNNGY